MGRLRLQYQLVLATFLPLFLFAVSSMAVGALALLTVPRNLILQRQVALAQVAAAGVAGDLRARQQQLETVADRLGQAVGDMGRQQQALRDDEPALSAFSGGVDLVDLNGTVIAVTPVAAANLGADLSPHGYVRAVLANGKPVYSAWLQAGPGGQPAVVIAVPVRYRGEAFGALVGEIRLDQGGWLPELDLLNTGDGGSAYLVDGSGTILYHPSVARTGRGVHTDAALWRLVQANRPQSLLRRQGTEDAPWLVAYAPIPGASWGLVVEAPWAPIWATMVPFQWLAVGLMAMGLLASLLSFLLSVRRVTRPLAALVAEGERVSAGKPFQPLPVAGPPDLRNLLRVVNRMVARLGEQQAQLRRYANRVLQGQEDERRRLSRELHDEAVQDLVALTQRVELCQDALAQDPAAVPARLDELQALAHRALTEVRRISNNLRPSILEDLGLAAALRTLTRELGEQVPGLRTHCEVVGREDRLPADLELAIYRVGQEALSNVRKHAAGASRVTVALLYEAKGVTLLVEDDGPGFRAPAPDETAGPGHLGLLGMRERAQLFGAELTLTTAPGQGTLVRLWVPGFTREA